MAMFYIAIVQAVLLYSAESWSVSKRDQASLDRFHKQAVRHITGVHIWRLAQGTWTYLDNEALLCKCRLKPMAVYVERCQGTLRLYLHSTKLELLQEVHVLHLLARDPHRVLWSTQLWKEKDMVEATVN